MYYQCNNFSHLYSQRVIGTQHRESYLIHLKKLHSVFETCPQSDLQYHKTVMQHNNKTLQYNQNMQLSFLSPRQPQTLLQNNAPALASFSPLTLGNYSVLSFQGHRSKPHWDSSVQTPAKLLANGSGTFLYLDLYIKPDTACLLKDKSKSETPRIVCLGWLCVFSVLSTCNRGNVLSLKLCMKSQNIHCRMLLTWTRCLAPVPTCLIPSSNQRCTKWRESPNSEGLWSRSSASGPPWSRSQSFKRTTIYFGEYMKGTWGR